MPSATVGILKVLLSADSAEYQAELKKAASAAQNFTKDVKTAGAQTEAVGAAMAKAFGKAEEGTKGLGRAMANMLGLDTIERANTYVAAVEKIGGVSKLTAAEQSKLNGFLTEASAKYQALGREAPAALTNLANATKPVSVETSKLSTWFGELGNQVKATALGFISAQAIIGTLQGSFRALVGFVSESVTAYAEQESAVKKLTTALQAQGRATPEVIRSYQDMAAQFQKTTVNSDELINEMQALLVEVGNVGPAQMEKALTAATDLAAGLGIDLRQATMLVGKAFEGETGTLKRYGIIVDEAKLKTEGVSAVMDAIQAKFGGQAQAEIETYAGKLKQLANTWNELQEAVGKSIVQDPVILQLMKQIKEEVQGAGDAADKSKATFTDWWTEVIGGQSALAAEIAISTILGLMQDVEATTARAMAAAKAQAAALPKIPAGKPQFGTDLIDTKAVLKSWEDAARELEALQKRIVGIRDALFGTGAIRQAKEYVEAIGPLANIAKMTREQQDKVNDVMAAALMAYRQLGQVAPKAVTDTFTATFNLDRLLNQIEPKIEALPSGLTGIGQAIEVGVLPPVYQLAKVIDGLPPGFEHVGRIAVPTFESVKVKAKQTHDEFDGLARAMADLAQVSGGSFGDIVQDIGELIAALALADKASEALEHSFDSIGAAFKDGLDFSGLTKGVTQFAAASVGAIAALATATDPSRKTTKQTVAGGAAVGAKIGSVAGPYGAVIGAGVGALVGWWRGSRAEWKKVSKDIGKEIGQDISDGLAQQIADLSKTLVGGTKQQRRDMAELFSLDAIIAEAGGLKSSNVQKYEKEATKLFEVIQRGGENGAKATQELNTLIGEFAAHAAKTGGMWDPVFKKLIADSKALGLNIDAVTAAIDEQISKLAGGLSAAATGAFAGTEKAFDDLVKGLSTSEGNALAKAFKDAQSGGFKATIGDFAAATLSEIRAIDAEMASLTDTTSEAGKRRLDELDKRGRELTDKLGGLSAATIAQFDKVLVTTQASFDRLSRTALASFNAIIASGKTAFQAIAEIGSTIDLLIAKHDELGLHGGAAFDQLARFRILTSQNAELVASVGGLNDVLVALANLGGLNVDVLADLEAQGLAAFQQLTVAGFTENEALQQMGPLLKSIIQAHKDLGIPIDENTQKLIDQATANGFLEDDTMSMVDVIKEGLGALIKGFGFDLPEAFKKTGKAGKDAAKDITDGINKIPKSVDVKVNYHPGDPKPEPPPLPPPDREPGDSGYRFAHGGAVPEYAAAGTTIGRVLHFKPRGTDTVPAMLTPGEGVLNTGAMRWIGTEGLAALNAGMSPGSTSMANASTLQKTGTDNQQVTVDVTVAGDIIDSRRRAVEIGTAIGKQLRTDAQLRDVWRTPIKGITKSGL